MFDDIVRPEKRPTGEPPVPHYYGDQVRGILLFIAATLLIAMLVDRGLIGLSVTLGVVAVLGLTLIAGYMTPRRRAVMQASIAATGVIFVAFEYFAIAAYTAYGSYTEPVFLLRQVVAVAALVAFYYSIKSLRGIIE